MKERVIGTAGTKWAGWALARRWPEEGWLAQATGREMKAGLQLVRTGTSFSTILLVWFGAALIPVWFSINPC